MKLFREHCQQLEEGRDSPLFHGTSLNGAKKILEDDLVKFNFQDSRLTEFGDNTHGLSLTRDFKRASMLSVVLEFDQAKIAQRYRIQPHQNQNWSDDESEEKVIPHKITQTGHKIRKISRLLTYRAPQYEYQPKGMSVKGLLTGIYVNHVFFEGGSYFFEPNAKKIAKMLQSNPLFKGTFER